MFLLEYGSAWDLYVRFLRQNVVILYLTTDHTKEGMSYIGKGLCVSVSETCVWYHLYNHTTNISFS